MQIRFDFFCSLGDRLRQFAIYNQDIDRFFRQKRTNFTMELNRILSQFLISARTAILRPAGREESTPIAAFIESGLAL